MEILTIFLLHEEDSKHVLAVMVNLYRLFEIIS